MVTSASDVYSAGLVLFEMLTGRRAGQATLPAPWPWRGCAGDPPVPSSIRSGIPQILDIAVRRALARVPADRPTAGDMAALLGRYIADPQGAVPPPPRCRGRRAVAGRLRRDGGRRSRSGRSATGAGAGGRVPQPQRPRGWQAQIAMARSGRGRPTATGCRLRHARATRRASADGFEDESEDGGAGAWAWVAAILGVLVLFAGGVLLFLLLSGRPPTASPGPRASSSRSRRLSVFSSPTRARTPRARASCSASAPIWSPQAPEGSVIAQEPASGTLRAQGVGGDRHGGHAEADGAGAGPAHAHRGGRCSTSSPRTTSRPGNDQRHTTRTCP